MKIIIVPETNIRIGVTTAEEMYRVFFRLGAWWDLEVDGKTYPASENATYTRGYFRKLFEEGLD